MGSGVESARKDIGLTDKDMTDLRAARRRHGLAVVLAGAVGAVAGAVTGIVVGGAVNSGNDDDYPYVLPAAAGLAGAASRKPKVGMAVAAVVGFLVTFFLFALATQTVSMYGVWHRD